jgi:copper chaperone
MFRRKFIQLAAAGPAIARATKTVTYQIQGFTCVTCAVGLDAMLRDQKGIIRSKSSYPDRTATIEFNPDLITVQQIRVFIQDLGFTAT